MYHNTDKIKEHLSSIMLENILINAYSTSDKSEDDFVKKLLEDSNEATNETLQKLGVELFEFAQQEYLSYTGSVLLHASVSDFYKNNIENKGMSEAQRVEKFVEYFKDKNNCKEIMQQYFPKSEDPVTTIAKYLLHDNLSKEPKLDKILKNIAVLKARAPRKTHAPENTMNDFKKIWMPSIEAQQCCKKISSNQLLQQINNDKNLNWSQSIKELLQEFITQIQSAYQQISKNKVTFASRKEAKNNNKDTRDIVKS